MPITGIIICGNCHFKNLQAIKKGCKLLQIPYIMTEDLNEMKRSNYNLVWCHSRYIDPTELPEKAFFYGPHFFVFPSQNFLGDVEDKYRNCYYNVLSEWNREIHKGMKIPLVAIPFGVDTEEFQPGDEAPGSFPRDEIFLYVKGRHPSIGEAVLKKLEGYKVNVIKYGSYKEDEYKEILKRCKFGVWVGSHESQGFALEEALSSGVPLLILNVKSMKEEFGEGRYYYEGDVRELKATTVPYWSKECGEVIYGVEEMEDGLKKMENGVYDPRKYVVENLSIEKCMKRMLKLFEKEIGYVMYANDLYKEALVNHMKDLVNEKVDVISFGEGDLTFFKEENKEIMAMKRGNGYWSWKPYVVLEAMKKGYKYVAYCDAGSKFSKPVEYYVSNMEKDFIVFSTPNKEICWTKRSVLVEMDCDQEIYKETNQIAATCFIVKNNEESRRIVEDWLNLCERRELITDEITMENYKEFCEHRHDQSLFSLVMKKNLDKILILPFSNVCQNFYSSYITKMNDTLLTTLGTKFGTDKVHHGFTAIYNRIFQKHRYTFTKVGEIGVFFGASILMWKEYFPYAVIHGLDAFQGLQGNGNRFEGYLDFYNQMEKNPDARIKLHVMDQSKREDLENFREENFDLLLDDGSHLMKDQQLSLGILFPLVKSGGYYVIEDIHTSNQDGYDVVKNSSNTTLDMIYEWKLSGKWNSMYLNEKELEYLQNNVKTADVYGNGNSMTCIITKI